VRKDWLTTVAAAVCAVGVAAISASGSPAGMAIASRPQIKPSFRASALPRSLGPLAASGAQSDENISPLRHPVKYLAAAVPDWPQAWKWGGGKDRPDAVPQHDSISLDKPTGSPTPQFVISLAQNCERQGDVLQARRHYQQALSVWPGQVEVLRAAARMEDRQGELKLAEMLYQQAVAANPQHAGALNDLALCLARQGRLEPSVQVIEHAIQLQPEKALYRNNAATVLVEMRQDQRALAHLAAVHGSAEANYNLGQLLVQRGRASDATPYFVAAIEQNPELQAAHVALAKLQGGGADAMTVTAPGRMPESTMPAEAGHVAPQQAPQSGPQLGYPATARSPQAGASSYVPYYAPSGHFGPAQDPRIGGRQPYLPPAGIQHGPVRR